MGNLGGPFEFPKKTIMRVISYVYMAAGPCVCTHVAQSPGPATQNFNRAFLSLPTQLPRWQLTLPKICTCEVIPSPHCPYCS